MKTPLGNIPIRQEVASKFPSMTDREIADKALKSSSYIDPEFFAELVNRGLSWRGCAIEDTYRMIGEREAKL
jgi:hypothetical protein